MPPFPGAYSPRCSAELRPRAEPRDRWPLDHTARASCSPPPCHWHAFRVKVKGRLNHAAIILLVAAPGTIKTHPRESALSHQTP